MAYNWGLITKSMKRRTKTMSIIFFRILVSKLRNFMNKIKLKKSQFFLQGFKFAEENVKAFGKTFPFTSKLKSFIKLNFYV